MELPASQCGRHGSGRYHVPSSESQHGAGTRLTVGCGIVEERALQLESGKSDLILHSFVGETFVL